MIKTLLLLSFAAVLLSCKGQHSVVATPLPAIPEILFLQLKVWKTGTDYKAEIQQKQRVPGLLPSNIRSMPLPEGQWMISFFDQHDQVLTRVSIPNPLEDHYETGDENGQLHAVEVIKDQADCFIRVQYDSHFYSFQIDQIEAGQKRWPIISLLF